MYRAYNSHLRKGKASQGEFPNQPPQKPPLVSSQPNVIWDVTYISIPRGSKTQRVGHTPLSPTCMDQTSREWDLPLYPPHESTPRGCNSLSFYLSFAWLHATYRRLAIRVQSLRLRWPLGLGSIPRLSIIHSAGALCGYIGWGADAIIIRQSSDSDMTTFWQPNDNAMTALRQS